jgi:hypothetical protein
MKPETRHVLLTAIAKARSWIQDIVEGRVASLAEIAAREGRWRDTSVCWHRWRLFHQ